MHNKWLFFDVGSTLLDETKAYEHRIKDAVAGTDVTYEMFEEKRMYFAEQNCRGDLEAIRFFGLKLTPWHSEDEFPYPDADRVLAYLFNKGFKLGVIANQPLGTEERLEKCGLLKYISVTAASAELGVAKPDKALFLKALEMAQTTPENSVMIGDRLDNDIYPAMSLGMKTVWIRQGYSLYQQLDDKRREPDHIIDTLTSLTEIF